MNVETGRRQVDIQKFDIDARHRLSKPDQRLLGILEKAVEAYGWVYAAQFDDRFPGANVYPRDITDVAILEAARNDPRILDPYHIVQKDEEGKLVPIPYHIKYAEKNAPVIALLREASGVALLSQAPYFLSSARALAFGMYEEQARELLTRKEEAIVDAIIAPNDRYDDRLFGVKYFAWGSVGLLNQEATEKAQTVVQEVLDVWEDLGSRPADMERPNIKVRLEDTTLLSGLAARYKFTANNLPCQQEWRKKYGNKIIVFLPPFEERVIYEQHPLLSEVVDIDRLHTISQEQLITSNLEFFLAHEAHHPLIRRIGDEERLRSSYTTFSEMNCSALALYTLHQKRTLEECNRLLTSFITKTVTDIQSARGGIRKQYALAHRSIISSLYEQGLLGINKGLVWWSSENPGKVFQGLEGLIDQLEKIAVSGNEHDFNDLLKSLDSRVVSRLNPLKYFNQ